jgi:hypothetical protein
MKLKLNDKIYQVGHFRPKIEAESDETFSQYLQSVVRRHQTSLVDLRHPDIYKNHEIRIIIPYRKSKIFLRNIGPVFLGIGSKFPTYNLKMSKSETGPKS